MTISAQKSDSLSKSPRDGSFIRRYIRFMRTTSGSKDEKVFLFDLAILIFSTMWGFGPAAKAGGTGERPELPSLYAAYVSLFNR